MIVKFFTHNGKRYHYSTIQIAVSIMARYERLKMTDCRKYHYAQRVAMCCLAGMDTASNFIRKTVDYTPQPCYHYATGGYPEIVGYV